MLQLPGMLTVKLTLWKKQTSNTQLSKITL